MRDSIINRIEQLKELNHRIKFYGKFSPGHLVLLEAFDAGKLDERGERVIIEDDSYYDTEAIDFCIAEFEKLLK